MVVETLLLQLVPCAGHEQRDLPRFPALIKKPVDLGIGLVDRGVWRTWHEPDRRAVHAAVPGLPGAERPEHLGDLLGVADVLIQHDRRQRDRHLAVPFEHPLRLVGERVQPAVALVAQAGQGRRPPGGADVLRLIDNDRVVLVVLAQGRGELAHLRGQPYVIVAG